MDEREREVGELEVHARDFSERTWAPREETVESPRIV
jgi:hypothetical protein